MANGYLTKALQLPMPISTEDRASKEASWDLFIKVRKSLELGKEWEYDHSQLMYHYTKCIDYLDSETVYGE